MISISIILRSVKEISQAPNNRLPRAEGRLVWVEMNNFSFTHYVQ